MRMDAAISSVYSGSAPSKRTVLIVSIFVTASLDPDHRVVTEMVAPILTNIGMKISLLHSYYR